MEFLLLTLPSTMSPTLWISLVVGGLTAAAGLMTAIVTFLRSRPERVNLSVTGMQSVVVSQSTFLDQLRADNEQLRRDNSCIRERLDKAEVRLDTLEEVEGQLYTARRELVAARDQRDRALNRVSELEERVKQLEANLEQTRRDAGLN